MNQEASYETQPIDHLGIVAGICREISLVKRIDTQGLTAGQPFVP